MLRSISDRPRRHRVPGILHAPAYIRRVLTIAILLAPAAGLAQDTRWDDRFPVPGVNGIVRAAVWFQGDLYVVGEFTEAGGIRVDNIARWDGRGWHAVGGGVSAGPVTPILTCITVYDSSLVVGGFFSKAGGVEAFSIARWDGAAWSEFGSGIGGEVDALLPVGDDLYVGGTFTTVANLSARRIARWDGEAWHALGVGIGTVNNDARVRALAHDGTYLYVAGDMRKAGGGDVLNLARWDGETWSGMGEGADATVYALAWFAGELYAGGRFTEIGGKTLPRLARWDGTAWVRSGPVVGTSVRALTVAGNRLYVGGGFSEAGGTGSNIVLHEGEDWIPLAGGISADVYTVAVAPDGTVAAAGNFGTAGTQFVQSVSVFADGRWHALGLGVNGPVYAAQVAAGGYYVGGDFSLVGGTRALNVAFWDGTEWSPVGEGADGPVHAFAVIGNLLYAAGDFSHMGDMEAANIAVWDGGVWSPVGDGLGSACRTLAVDQNNMLYAGGNFNNAGGTATGRIARWNGATWSALGSGIPAPGSVNAITVQGGVVFAAGVFFQAGGRDAANVARFLDGEWSPLGVGTNGEVRALAATTAGVYAVGDFFRAGGNDANGLALWDGTAWSSEFSAGIDSRPITAILAAGEDSIYIGGTFRNILGEPVSGIAVWDGSGWQPLGDGINGRVDVILGDGNDLLVGGEFTRAGEFASANFAHWNPGGATPVQLLAVDARRVGDRVALAWRVADPEGELLGFHIHRESPGGERDRITSEPLLGGGEYRFEDVTAPLGEARYWLYALTRNGSGVWFGPVLAGPALRARVLWSRPNPFRGATRVGYRLEQAGAVRLEVFDVSGRVVRVLEEGPRGPGDHETTWDGTDDQGRPLGGGVFFYRLRTAAGSITRKIVALP